jgi:GMP synthase-like glutamine amidotransferase
MKIHCLTHVPFEKPRRVAEWASARGYAVEEVPLWDGAPLPPPESVESLVLMGGPMSVNDEREHPWLPGEKALVRNLAGSGERVLGICLGAQLIAAALGARVYPNRSKEIGWFPVRLTAAGRGSPLLAGFPAEFEAFHWHGETFDLPPGAVHLAESTACRNQAFSAGAGVLALQFHLELDPAGLRGLVENCRSELAPGEFIQPEDRILAGGAASAELGDRLFGLLDRWAGTGL